MSANPYAQYVPKTYDLPDGRQVPGEVVAAVFELRILGTPYAEIAAQCGLSPAECAVLVNAEATRLNFEESDQATIRLEILRLEKMARTMLAVAEGGEPKAVKAYLDILEALRPLRTAARVNGKGVTFGVRLLPKQSPPAGF